MHSMQQVDSGTEHQTGRRQASFLEPVTASKHGNSEMAEEFPTFPVLCIARNGFLTTVSDRNALETCGQSALDSGYFNGMLLVDPTGTSWEVRSAERVASVGPLRGWRLSRSRRIRVQLELAQSRRFDLTALQDRVCEAIDRLPAQWEVVEDPADTKARVRRAGTIPDLISLFAGQS